ncbi:MAG: 50S ribosomal protein L24 [Clostridia bacterium]|nr:50S ribosomal protein L24 [Clostridia bacterium]
MAKLSIRKDDYVMIITGKDKGKTALIAGINAEKGRALIEGKDLKTVNKKAVKARKASDKGGLVEQPGTIAISNVMPICAACNKPTRVGHGLVDGKSVRICKECGEVLVTKKVTARKSKASKTTEAAPEKKAKATVRKRVKAEAPVTEEVAAAPETAAEAPAKEE